MQLSEKGLIFLPAKTKNPTRNKEFIINIFFRTNSVVNLNGTVETVFSRCHYVIYHVPIFSHGHTAPILSGCLNVLKSRLGVILLIVCSIIKYLMYNVFAS